MVAESFLSSPPSVVRGYRAISEYSIIGDCRTAALVATDASIDWLCLPHFDSEAVLSRLIGAPSGGFLELTEIDNGNSPYPISQRYIENTAILQTEIAFSSGNVAVTDYMPTSERQGRQHWQEENSCIVRNIEALSGPCTFAVRFKVSPDYGRTVPRMTVSNEGVIATSTQHGDGVIILAFANGNCDGILESEPHGPFACQLTLNAGDKATIVLGWAQNPFQASQVRRSYQHSWQQAFEATKEYWQQWSEATTYAGPYRQAVVRSAITLKLLTFAPTGAMVAAPTTSLPELIGGQRNWDYRYTWIRDGSLAAGALTSLGHTDEALAFIHWVEHRERRSDRELRVMYGIRGDRELPEMEVPPLEGYRKSGPVRIGNGAVDQHQLDIYGEWLDCVTHVYLRPDAQHPDHWLWALIEATVTFVCDHWMEPDAGIWEIRSAQQSFVYSKIMCWTAVDRGIALAERFHWPVDLERWQRVRNMIHNEVIQRGVDPDTNSFRISYESDGLDAATLMIPLIGFLPAHDPRVIATTDAINRYLTNSHGFAYRYRDFEDGVGGEEGTFVMCSYWLAENLALQGRRSEAIHLFESLLGHASPTGLLSEMVDSSTGELLGNYPQAFSHLGLIRTALALEQFDKTTNDAESLS